MAVDLTACDPPSDPAIALRAKYQVRDRICNRHSRLGVLSFTGCGCAIITPARGLYQLDDSRTHPPTRLASTLGTESRLGDRCLCRDRTELAVRNPRQTPHT